MKRLAFLTVLLLGATASYSSTPPPVKVTMASVSGEWNNFRPNCLYYQRAGIPDWNAVGFNVGLTRYQWDRWSLQPRFGMSYGAITFNNLQQNVELAVGGIGNYNAKSTRMGYHVGVQAGMTLGEKQFFAIEIPVYASVRYIGHEGFFLDDGNSIIAGDLGNNETFNGDFGVDTQFGFQSGAEFVLFPLKPISIYTRFNFTYFGKRDVYNVAETGITPDGIIDVSSESVKATGNYGWAAGIRFNLQRSVDQK